MLSQDELADKITNTLRQTGDGFEGVFPGTTSRFVSSIVPAYANLLSALDRLDEVKIEGVYVPWQLLWDACNSLLASYTLFQRGYSIETLAVMRTVLERVACALVLFDNPTLIPRFHAGELRDLGTRAIGPAAGVITGFGRLFGLLSRVGTHVSNENFGVGFVDLHRDDQGNIGEFAIGGVIKTAGSRADAWEEMHLQFEAVASQILAAAPEQIFFKEKRKRAQLELS